MKNIKEFISISEKWEIISFVNSLNIDIYPENRHIKTVAAKLSGKSYMFDISKTEKSNKLSKFQSSDTLVNIELPEILLKLVNRISERLFINSDNVFLQILKQGSGGMIHPHYDSAIDGYITYKCNICVESGDYKLFTDGGYIDVSERDLYSFEASLYKHWSEPFKDTRIILSYGFILPYRDLGRDENDPRVRLSKRIIKHFQK